MSNSDKCKEKGISAIKQDFLDSITGQYVDITFKIMTLFSGLFALMVAGSSTYLYWAGEWGLLKGNLVTSGVIFLVTYCFGYYWIYNNVYEPVHSISTRLLSEQQSIDVWPDNGNFEGEDILEWQNGEIAKLLENIIILQEQVELIANMNLEHQKLNQTVEGDFGKQFDKMVRKLQKLQKQSLKIAELDLSDEILDRSVGGAVGQAFETMTDNLEDFVRRLDDVALTANESSEFSRDAASTAQEGTTKIDELADLVEEIDQAINQVSKAIGVVDDIAQETNILALNAAVEAAHAGEEGDSFAVVAEEIRELSQRSARAANKINDITDQCLQKASKGAQFAEESRDKLQDIEEQIISANELMKKTAYSTEELQSEIDTDDPDAQTGIE
jgi:hypothetical protein